MIKIRLLPKDVNRALRVMAEQGKISWTAKPRVYWVPNKTVAALKRRQIPFDVLTDSEARSAARRSQANSRAARVPSAR